MSDSGLTFERSPDTRSTSDLRRTVQLDFRDATPKLEHCKMLYLGTGTQYRESGRIFIILEKSANERFRRIGYSRLDLDHDQLKVMLSLAEKKVVIIE
jgi:hypothetical protein